MLRRRHSLLLFFCGLVLWSVSGASQGCNDSFAVSTGGGGSGGLGTNVRGNGGHNYPTCEACFDARDGAPANQCAIQSDACDADVGCLKLVACVTQGFVGNVGGSGGSGGTTTSGSGGAGGSGGTGGATTSSTGGGGAGGSGGKTGSGGAGGKTGSGGTTSGGGATPGSGGAPAETNHGPCDDSFLGACCTLDCIAALQPSEASKEKFLQRTRCLQCDTCKSLCGTAEMYCQVLQDGGAALCGR